MLRRRRRQMSQRIRRTPVPFRRRAANSALTRQQPMLVFPRALVGLSGEMLSSRSAAPGPIAIDMQMTTERIGAPLNELISRLSDYDLNVDDLFPSAAISDASARIAEIYSQLLVPGVTDEVVARAMIGATVSLYDTIGLLAVLPTVLRTVADKIESDLLLAH